MCLGIPAKIVEIVGEDFVRMGRVDFGGAIKEVALAYVPEAEVGDYVLVHVGFALSVLDEEEAAKTLEALAELSVLRDAALAEDPGGGGS